MQVVQDPHKYTPDLLMRQAAMHMLRNPFRYYKPLEHQLTKSGESFESYVFNVFHKNVRGDDLVAAVIGDMWNVAISIVTPIHKKPVALFHNKEFPDIVIVANGGDYMSKEGSTHFSTTRCFAESFKIPGSEYRNPTLCQDLSKKLDPIVLEDPKKATQVACHNFIKYDEEKSLKLLRGLCHNIDQLDDTVCELIKQGEEIRQQKTVMEYQMEKIGISCEKIKEATAVLKGEKEYVRTQDRECHDAEMERKRKAEEQMRDEEEKRLKTITAGEQQEQEKEETDEEEHCTKLAQQQKEIIRQQEQLLQQQERYIEEQERRLRRLEQEKIDKESQPQQSGSVQQSSAQTRSAPKPSTSGSGKIDKYLKPSAMRFLSCVKKERCEEDEEEEEKEEDEVMITGVTEKPKRYIPKVIEGVPNVVLMEVPKSQRSAKCQRGPPVPEGRRDHTRFYCENCDANYNRPDELVWHQRRDCGKVDAEHFCDSCGKGFAQENGVREHYYHQHTNITLWFCQKCGKGFNFKSNKSTHLKTCPLKDGPDKYVPRTPYDAVLEVTFKKRQAVPLQVVGQQAGDNPPQQVANPPPQQEQPETTPPQAAEATPPQAAETTPPQAAETTLQQTAGNPALIIVPAQVGDPQQLPRTEQLDDKEKSVYDEEAAKAVRSIEGEDLLQVLSSGVIPDERKLEEEGNGEEKPEELDLEMVFDD